MGRGVLLCGQYKGGEGCYHGDSTMGRGVLPWRHYIGEVGCYHADSRIGERVVTMETVQWGRRVLP